MMSTTEQYIFAFHLELSISKLLVSYVNQFMWNENVIECCINVTKKQQSFCPKFILFAFNAMMNL